MKLRDHKKHLKRFYFALMLHAISLFMSPKFVLASSSGGGQSSDTSRDTYLPQLEKFYSFDVGQIDKMDWFLRIVGGAGTVITVGAFMYWIWKLVVFFFQVRTSRADLGDVLFWKRMAWSLVLILFFMGGFTTLLLSQFYDFVAGEGGDVF